MKPGPVIAIFAIVIGTVLGTAFSKTYGVPISSQLGLLFGLIGLVLAMLGYGLWRWARGKKRQ